MASNSFSVFLTPNTTPQESIQILDQPPRFLTIETYGPFWNVSILDNTRDEALSCLLPRIHEGNSVWIHYQASHSALFCGVGQVVDRNSCFLMYTIPEHEVVRLNQTAEELHIDCGTELPFSLAIPRVWLWAHAVNTREKLTAALKRPLSVLFEADVAKESKEEGIEDLQPFMGHDLAEDISLSQWLTSSQGRGIKIDIKSNDLVSMCCSLVFDIVYKQIHETQTPIVSIEVENHCWKDIPLIFINADVLSGPGGKYPNVQVDTLMQAIELHFLPTQCIVSLGWTTCEEWQEYTEEMINEMISSSQVRPDYIYTFAVRGSYVRSSWSQLQRLLSNVQGSTLTVWSNTPLPFEEHEWLLLNLPPSRTFFDLHLPRE